MNGPNLDDLRAQATLDEGNHRAWDTMAVELEVAELLYALVRQCKPNLVVECGSGKGYASAFIAHGLEDNAFGTLTTFEQDAEYADEAAARLAHLPAYVARAYSHEWAEPSNPDLVFIDSLGGEPRERDMDHWFACESRPLIVIHDANGYPPETFSSRGVGVLLDAGRGVWIGRAA